MSESLSSLFTKSNCERIALVFLFTRSNMRESLSSLFKNVLMFGRVYMVLELIAKLLGRVLKVLGSVPKVLGRVPKVLGRVP